MDLISYDPTRPHITDMEGKRVVRGPDWKWGNQDKFPGNVGTVTGMSDPDNPKYLWIRVQWDNGDENEYRWGYKEDGLPKFDLEIVEGEAAEPKQGPKGEPKFKAGDRVDHIMDEPDYKDGEVLEVRDGGTTIKVRWPSGSVCADPVESLVPHVEEEAKEAAPGRKFSVDQWVRTTEGSEPEHRRGEVGQVIEDDGTGEGDNPYKVRFKDRDTEWYSAHELEAAEEPEPEAGESPAGPKAIGCRVKLNEGGLEEEGTEYEDREGTMTAWDGDDEGREVEITFDDGEELWVATEHAEIVALPKAKAEAKIEPVKPKFDLGDRVTGKSNLGDNETGKVIGMDPDPHTHMKYKIRCEGDGAEVWMENEGLRLADTDAPECEECGFKPGDQVRVKASVTSPRYGWGRVRPGHVGTVMTVEKNGSLMAVDFPVQRGWSADHSEMELVTAATEHEAKPVAPGTHPTGPEFVGAKVRMLPTAGEACDCPFYRDFKDQNLKVTKWDTEDASTPVLAEAPNGEDHWFSPSHLEVVAMAGDDTRTDVPVAGEQAKEGAQRDLTVAQLLPFELVPVVAKAFEHALDRAKEQTTAVFEELARQFGFENLKAVHESGLRITINRKDAKAALEKQPPEGEDGAPEGLRMLLEGLRRRM